MKALQTDTITALATPPGRSAIALLRVSGPDAFEIADRILRRRRKKVTASYGTQTLHRALVVDGQDTVDDVLVAVFHAPRSYTGENAVEITCHGGSVPVRRILRLLLNNGARIAEPGEFTLRAYLNGKLDLAQAEAVADQINAQTDEAFRLAHAQQAGRLSAAVGGVRDSILGIVARIEATIDFPEDVGDFPTDWCRDELSSIAAVLDRLIASAARGMLYRQGISVVLAGLPNAGKSSLLNALLRSDRAIVTPLPGTTRDVIEESIDIRGIPVRLSDTAGLRDSPDIAEQMGVERTRMTLAQADIVLHVRDATFPEARNELAHAPPSVIVVWNKIDLVGKYRAPAGGVPVSALTGQGVEALEDRIAELALAGAGDGVGSDAMPTVSHARHKHALQEARSAVRRASDVLATGMPLDFLSIEAQSALASVGLITGETAPQDIINEIFHKFCIGK